jgi:hypothetical protein
MQDTKARVLLLVIVLLIGFENFECNTITVQVADTLL